MITNETLDELFADIAYDDANHAYSHNGKSLVSGTVIAKWIGPFFDKHAISAKIAEQRGVPQSQVLDEWLIGMKRGTKMHQYAEDVLLNRCDPVSMSVNERMPEMDGFYDAIKSLRMRHDMRVVSVEHTIGDVELGISGRFDTLLDLDIDGVRKLCLFDWKINNKFDVVSKFGSLKPPFSRYSSSKLNKFSAQLCVYRIILERALGIELGGGFILHLQTFTNEYNLYRAIDMRAEMIKWLCNGVPDYVLGDPVISKKFDITADFLRSLDYKKVDSASGDSRENFRRSLEHVQSLFSVLETEES